MMARHRISVQKRGALTNLLCPKCKERLRITLLGRKLLCRKCNTMPKYSSKLEGDHVHYRKICVLLRKEENEQ